MWDGARHLFRPPGGGSLGPGASPPYHALIDTGALITGMTNLEVAHCPRSPSPSPLCGGGGDSGVNLAKLTGGCPSVLDIEGIYSSPPPIFKGWGGAPCRHLLRKGLTTMAGVVYLDEDNRQMVLLRGRGLAGGRRRPIPSPPPTPLTDGS